MTTQTGRRQPRTPKATKLPGIPKPPADASASLRQYLTSVSEALEIRLGRKGDPRDAAVTFRDLIESGIAVEVYYGGGGGGGISNPGNPDGPGKPGLEDPTAPTGLRASGAMYNVSVFWNAARYEYGGHSYTEIWRAGAIKDANGVEVPGQEPTIDDAVLVGSSVGTTYVDDVGAGAIVYYWARHVNLNGDIGPYGYPYPSGVRAETSPDIEIILEALEGQIGEDQLTQDLQSQIALIDELEGFTGYYDSWRVDGDLVQRINAVSSSVGDNQTVVQELAQAVDGLEGQYTVKIQTNTAGGTYVSGFGLAQGPVDGAIKSRFIVAADQFAIINPANYPLGLGASVNQLEDYVPFVVQTNDSSYDGIFIPKGVYIKQAYIGKANVLELIAGSVVADYMESTVAMSTPSIFGGTINIGTIVKPPGTGPRDWAVVGSQRVGNFSVNADGIMHAKAAKLYGITIYASDGTVLLDSGGLSQTASSVGSNLIPNGELAAYVSTRNTSGPYNMGGRIYDNQYTVDEKSAFPGWRWSEDFGQGNENPSSASYYDAINNRFVLSSFDSIESDLVRCPSLDDPLTFYISVEVWQAASVPWQAGFRLFNTSGQNIYNAFLDWSSSGWANENGYSPTQVTGIHRFDGVIEVPGGYSKAAFMRGFLDSTGSGATSFYSVYIGIVPRVIDPKYARSYIRDLSVQTLMIQDEAVIVSSAVSSPDSASETIPSSGWMRSNVVTPRIEWLAEGRPSALFIQANAAMPPDVAGGASDNWDTVGYRLIAARNASFTSSLRYSPQITFQCRQQDPAYATVGWKFTETSLSGWYFALYVYAANPGGRRQPVKFLRGVSIIVHGIKK